MQRSYGINNESGESILGNLNGYKNYKTNNSCAVAYGLA
jgi:hypothetical protein